MFAVSDGRRKNPLSPGLVPLVVFIAILGIAVAFGMQTGMSPFIIFQSSLINSPPGFAINPARDLGPRVMTAMVGYGREGAAIPSRSVTVSNLIPSFNRSFQLPPSVLALGPYPGLRFWRSDCSFPL